MAGKTKRAAAQRRAAAERQRSFHARRQSGADASTSTTAATATASTDTERLEALEVLDLDDFTRAMDDVMSLVACACCGELKKESEIARAEEADVSCFTVLCPDMPIKVQRTTTADGLLRVCKYCWDNGLKKGKRPHRAFHFSPIDERLTVGPGRYCSAL